MKLIVIIILLSIKILSQDDSIIKLFPGKWKLDTERAELYEEWNFINKTELTGKSYGIENGEQIIVEELCIKKIGNHWAYISVPKEQTITLFALTGFSGDMFIFENKEHDFPQRIIYEFYPDGKLIAAIEGNYDGKNLRKEYSFSLVEN
jgi:hypothetical protein